MLYEKEGALGLSLEPVTKPREPGVKLKAVKDGSPAVVLDRPSCCTTLEPGALLVALQEGGKAAVGLREMPYAGVIGQLKALGHSQADTVAWMLHWMREGFTAFPGLIRPDTPFCFGEAPGLADLCLVAQIYNARRWHTDLTPFARLVEIDARCQEIEAIARAMPDTQPDAP